MEGGVGGLRAVGGVVTSSSHELFSPLPLPLRFAGARDAAAAGPRTSVHLRSGSSWKPLFAYCHATPASEGKSDARDERMTPIFLGISLSFGVTIHVPSLAR